MPYPLMPYRIPYIAIYALVDPRTDDVRYVGKSNDLKSRLRHHLIPRTTSWKDNWIRELLSEGLSFRVEVLEWATDANWVELERKWIAHYRDLGCRLTNLLGGGDGRDGTPLDEGHRAAISRGLMGREVSKSTRKCLSDKARKRWSDPEFKARVAEAFKRPEVVAKTRRGAYMCHAARRAKKFQSQEAEAL